MGLLLNAVIRRFLGWIIDELERPHETIFCDVQLTTGLSFGRRIFDYVLLMAKMNNSATNLIRKGGGTSGVPDRNENLIPGFAVPARQWTIVLLGLITKGTAGEGVLSKAQHYVCMYVYVIIQ